MRYLLICLILLAGCSLLEPNNDESHTATKWAGQTRIGSIRVEIDTTNEPIVGSFYHRYAGKEIFADLIGEKSANSVLFTVGDQMGYLGEFHGEVRGNTLQGHYHLSGKSTRVRLQPSD